jgi:hypothetical protein
MENTMRSKGTLFHFLLLVPLVVFAGSAVLLGASSSQKPADVVGTWSGTFQSRQPHFSPFTITTVISEDAKGHLTGNFSVSSDCLKDGTLQVTVNGSNLVLAGGDEEGDHITFTGQVDGTGTLLKLRYVLNSSASARCESDDGAGNMVKR